MSSISFPIPETRPITVPVSIGNRWMISTVIIAVLMFYFIGIDQGATSVFGHNLYIHEFVHDARHFLGFPCH